MPDRRLLRHLSLERTFEKDLERRFYITIIQRSAILQMPGKVANTCCKWSHWSLNHLFPLGLVHDVLGSIFCVKLWDAICQCPIEKVPRIRRHKTFHCYNVFWRGRVNKELKGDWWVKASRVLVNILGLWKTHDDCVLLLREHTSVGMIKCRHVFDLSNHSLGVCGLFAVETWVVLHAIIFNAEGNLRFLCEELIEVFPHGLLRLQTVSDDIIPDFVSLSIPRVWLVQVTLKPAPVLWPGGRAHAISCA